MKSVMQEASSLAKAIEQAWAKAGHPQEFSIKILEEPQKNFIGYTTRSAKVALFFETQQAPATAKSRSAPKRQPLPPVHEAPRPAPHAAPQQERGQRYQQIQGKKREYKPQWNDSMIDCTKNWVSDTLSVMGLSNVKFKIEPSDFYLRITFDKDLLPDQSKEKKLFASFATLIIETLKKTFKTSLRGHKIVLVHATNSSYDTQQR
jgi:hypothetical protein